MSKDLHCNISDIFRLVNIGGKICKTLHKIKYAYKKESNMLVLVTSSTWPNKSYVPPKEHQFW